MTSVASGKWLRSTTPPRRGWQSMHWSGVIKNYVRALEEATSSNSEHGGCSYKSLLAGVCVPFFGHKATCVFEPVFSAFFGKLMLEFF